ncbi:MAG: hypothetical protein KIS88_09650 [Anaerolineales bacterium]|nr:hypothetical protein [Anaerolineales bacterium]
MLSLTSDPQDPLITRIQHWGLGNLAAALLEHGGAFAHLVAQSLYVAEPLLAAWLSESSLRAFAGMMEDPSQRQALADALRDPQP